MADEYMRLADRLIKKVPTNEKTDKQDHHQRSASIYVAISSLAFAIEVHLKSILYTNKKGTAEGHDLERLWNALPEPIQTWLSEVFDQNFDSENQKWNYNIIFSPLTSKPRPIFIYKPIKLQFPENTALGMIQGHRTSFQQGRYAYELPLVPKLKYIYYNLEGLQLLAWLTRALAIQVHNEFELAKKTNKIKDLGDHLSVTINFPRHVEKFPSN